MMEDNESRKRGRRGKKKSMGRSRSENGDSGNGRNAGAGTKGTTSDSVTPKQDMEAFPVVSDTRFSSMHNAPTFERRKPDERKVKLDDRFKAVLTDPRFQLRTGKMDKYGRKVSTSLKKTENQLRAFYKVDGEDDGEEDSLDGDANDADDADDVQADEAERPLRSVTGEGKRTRQDVPEKARRGKTRLSEKEVGRAKKDPVLDDQDSVAGEEDNDDDEDDDDDDDGLELEDVVGNLDENDVDEDDEDDEDEDEDDEDAMDIPGIDEGVDMREEKDEDKELEVNPGDVAGESRQDYLTRLSRGDISDLSSSSDEESESEAGSDDSGSDGEATRAAGLVDPDSRGEAVPTSEDTSRRIAVTNCDWDHIRAKDLMVLCGSFCPSGSRVMSVTVFPSDFGLEMMKIEAAAGPHAAIEGTSIGDRSQGGDRSDGSAYDEGDGSEGGGEEEDDSDGQLEAEDRCGKGEGSEGDGGYRGGKGGRATVTSAGVAVGGRVVKRRKPGLIIENTLSLPEEEEEGARGENGDGRGRAGEDAFDPEKLRLYELRKLKYYFAVLECSSTGAGEAVYREVDGMEFEHSSMALDLRFVPDGVSFEGRTVRDRCTSVPSSYEPPGFICRALQQTKVKCTWDEVPSERKALLGRMSQWGDAAEEDFEAYLASSGAESSDDDDGSEGDSPSEGGKEDGGFQEEDGEVNGGTAGRPSRKREAARREKAERARLLLLGDALASDDEGEGGGREDGVEGGGASGEGKRGYRGGEGDEDTEDESGEEFSYTPRDSFRAEGIDEGEEGDAESGTEFTFVPRRGGAAAAGAGDGIPDGPEGLLARKKLKEALAKETPWEASLRKERERKRARKKALKEKMRATSAADEGSDGADSDGGVFDEEMQGGTGDDDFFLGEDSGRTGLNKARKNGRQGPGKRGRQADEEKSVGDLGEDDEEEDKRDYDMHRLAREDRLRGKKLRGKRKRKEEAMEKAPGQDFKIDLADERFAAVMEGDTRFGIDRTDANFKDTEGMRQILEERWKRKDRLESSREPKPMANGSHARGDDGKSVSSGGHSGAPGARAGDGRSKPDLTSLVNKLKARGLQAPPKRPGDQGRKPTVGSAMGGADEDGALREQAGVGADGGGGGKGRRGKKKRRKA